MSRLLAPEKNPSKWLTLAAACLGLAMLMVDSFVVAVALPAMSRSLNAPVDSVEWVVSAYVLTLGVLPLAAGRLGDIFGRREVYLAGLLLFIAGSAACASAPNVYFLVLCRVFQGSGAAIMQPTTLAIVTHAFPARQRGLAVGIWGGVSGLGLIVGPILGGLLVHGDSWRLIFLVNLPVGALALLMALRYIRSSRDESAPRRVDLRGLTLLASGLFLIMLSITEGSAAGWSSLFILGCLTGGSALLVLFVLAEWHTPAPLVDLSLFRRGTFVVACLAAALFSAAVFGSQPYTSVFMQSYWGFSPLQSGLAFLPATALVATLMPVSGALGERLGGRLRLLVMTGALLVAASFLYLLRLNVSDGYLVGFLPAFVLRGAGIGLFISATSLAVVSAVPLEKSGLAAGTLSMARNVGTSIGIAVLGSSYVQYVQGSAASQFALAPTSQAHRLGIAAQNFLPAGSGVAHLAAQRIIVDGYVFMALICLAAAVAATIAAAFIRHRVPVAGPSSNEAPAGLPDPERGVPVTGVSAAR